MSVEICGRSDDLIEIEGDIREEFCHYSTNWDEPKFLFFSNGVVLSVTYNGLWKFNLIRGKASQINYKHIAIDPDSNQYSDIFEVLGDIKWVGFGDELR